MALSVVMPALEMAQETGKVVSWLKKNGDHVAKGEMLLEVETDKAVVEIEALGDGILAGITAQVGDVVPVGHTIAWLLRAGEAVPSSSGPAVPTGRTMTTAAPVVTAAPEDTATSGGGSVRTSPKARRLAREHGIDITTLRGSGPGGEILAEDVEAAAGRKAERVEPAVAAEPLSSIGRLMAERTTASWTTVPHFFLARDVDASGLVAARERLLSSIETSRGVKVTHSDLLVAAVARTLRAHPRLNASWSETGIVTHAHVGVALAMAVENAVVTAVIPDADTATIGDIAVRRRDLAERARANRLTPADIAGATFTISNLGMFEVDAFTAIIVPPQAAILAVGAITSRVVAIDGEAAVRPTMTITLSSDHRVVDGARAAAFMTDLVRTLREPDWAH
ncbi:MAG: 2-oxo acid dehydrogenase subunit E2 [Acidobacteria bacterium]|nr:2-oxo acid dehydrogenase subunit E2 [Acidobacteriota bacterium]